MKVLANDGLTLSNQCFRRKKGFTCNYRKSSSRRTYFLHQCRKIRTLLVEVQTKVTKEIIDNRPSLQIIGRGGVGMDNIEVAYAREKGLHVINTPATSSESVAELVLHIYLGCRFYKILTEKCQFQSQTEFAKLKNLTKKV